MTELSSLLKQKLPYLESNLIEEIIAKSSDVTFPAHQQILREGQYIKTIPLVISGLLKVNTSHGAKEILLYYIQSSESCIMSFAFGMSAEPSNIAAHTESETRVILLNVDDVKKWITLYPSINMLFFNQYNNRYKDLVETIGNLIYEKLDFRIYQYLKQRASLNNSDTINIPHREIADDLASSREVVSRLLKKLELENKISISKDGMKILV